MKNEKMMREASPIKLLITMGLPTIVVMIVQVLYNMADVFFIGQGGDPMQVAALSLSGPAFGVFQGVGTLFGAGGCTAIAMALGQGDREKARYFSSFCACNAWLCVPLIPEEIVISKTSFPCSIEGDTALIIEACDTSEVLISAPLVIFS